MMKVFRMCDHNMNLKLMCCLKFTFGLLKITSNLHLRSVVMSDLFIRFNVNTINYAALSWSCYNWTWSIECGHTDDLMRLIGAQTRVDLPVS